jgi:hypothetical protein
MLGAGQWPSREMVKQVTIYHYNCRCAVTPVCVMRHASLSCGPCLNSDALSYGSLALSYTRKIT